MRHQEFKFEEMTVDETEGFSYLHLGAAFYDAIKLNDFNAGTLVTLGLSKNNQYTQAGRLFSDINTYAFGIDIVKFGENASEFLKRLRLNNLSILTQFNESMTFFDQYYHDYEVITNGERQTRIRLPRNAFREALANAIVHRDYQINANIQIEFWDTYIKITSPGGLTSDISEAQYLNGGISVPRNPIIANIFYRLKIIETFGTGIGRIKNAYLPFGQSPSFHLTDKIIQVTLPTIDYKKTEIKNGRDSIIVDFLKNNPSSRTDIQNALGLGASATKSMLNTLISEDRIERFGKGPRTKYRLR